MARRGKFRKGVAGGLILASALGAAAQLSPASACQLALVLAIDVSSSVDMEEYQLQARGLARALSDDEVKDAILTTGGIWLSSFEWSGRHKHVVQVDWVFLDDGTLIDETADRLANTRRASSEFPTALGYALGYASVHLKKVPEPCFRKVVDVSGDGVNNEGFGPDKAYSAFDFNGVTVNGLVVKGADPDPEDYYRREVRRGPGAFVEVARGYGDYTRAMKRKLLREINGGAFADRR